MKSEAEIRALEVMQSVPAGCILFPISDERSSPHLRLGEFAVVDTADRLPAVGELYVIKWNSGMRCVVLVCRAFVGGRSADEINRLWVGPYALTSQFDGRRLRSVDGPYAPDHLAEKIVGRVIGFFVSPLDSAETAA